MPVSRCSLLWMVLLCGCSSGQEGSTAGPATHQHTAGATTHQYTAGTATHQHTAGAATSAAASAAPASSRPAPALDARRGQELGLVFEAFLSPHQEPDEEENTPSLTPEVFRSSALDYFQVGAGLVLALPERFDAFVEVVPVGERAAALALGDSF